MRLIHHLCVVVAIVVAAAVIGFGCSHKQDIAPIPELGITGPDVPLGAGEELQPPESPPPEGLTITDVKLVLPNGEEVGLDSKRIHRFSMIKVKGDLGDAVPRLQPYVKLEVDSEEEGVIVYKHAMPFHDMMTYKLTLGGSEHSFVVGSPGDANGDGFSDILEALYIDTENQGRIEILVNLMYGGLTSMTDAATFNAQALGNVQFGRAMTLSDVNGDGYADVIIGAPMANQGKGCLYVFHGGPRDKFADDFFPGLWSEEEQKYLRQGMGMSVTEADTTICTDTPAPALFGSRIASGDVDGNGFGDIIVGEPVRTDYAPLPEQDENQFAGAVYVFKGSPQGLGTGTRTVSAMRTGDEGPLDYEFRSSRSRGFLGRNVTAADIDADGKDEIIAAAPGIGYDSNGPLPCVRGKVYIVPGNVAESSAFINQVGQELSGDGCTPNGETDSFGGVITPARIVMHINPYMDALIIGAKGKNYRYVEGLRESPKLAEWHYFEGRRGMRELWPGHVGIAVPDENYVQICMADKCPFKYSGELGEGVDKKFGWSLTPTGNHIGGTFSFAIGELDHTTKYTDENGVVQFVDGGAVYLYGYNRAQQKFGYQLREGGFQIPNPPGSFVRIGGKLVGGRIR